jgi:hypothetical protein
MLSTANQPVWPVVTAAGVADSEDSQILVVKLCQRSKVDACRRVVITVHEIQTEQRETRGRGDDDGF